MRNLSVASLVLATAAITGCAHTMAWEAEASCSQKDKCAISGKISGTLGGNAQSLLNSMLVATDIPDAALFEIDVTGSSITYPATGTATLTLTDSGTGTVQAAKLFAWYRTGTVLKLTDPSAVNAWAASEGGSADALTYKISPFTAGGTTSGQNTISVKSKYDGAVTASAVSTFTSCSKYNTPALCSGS